MESKYKYEGKVDIEQVEFEMYAESYKNGDRRFKSSPRLHTILKLHNEGMSPSEISKEITKMEGLKSRIPVNNIRTVLDRAKVKPNEAKSPIVRHKSLKLLDAAFHRKLIVTMMSFGYSQMEALRAFNNIVTYNDGTTERITSEFILNNLIKKANKAYIDTK